MIFVPTACVVDASVGVKLFVAEDSSSRADALFSHLSAEPPAAFYVPDLFYVECANILWKHVRRFGHPADSARQDIVDLRDLALHSVPTAELLDVAIDLALQYHVTAYDACYVALAQQLGAPLVTADEPLAARMSGAGFPVLHLRDLEIEPLI
jgi:predicted nucleic acid-binding protein